MGILLRPKDVRDEQGHNGSADERKGKYFQFAIAISQMEISLYPVNVLHSIMNFQQPGIPWTAA